MSKDDINKFSNANIDVDKNIVYEITDNKLVWYDRLTGEIIKIVDTPSGMKKPIYPSVVKMRETCPWCGGKIKEYTNRHDGSTFYGCSNFPKCKFKYYE